MVSNIFLQVCHLSPGIRRGCLFKKPVIAWEGNQGPTSRTTREVGIRISLLVMGIKDTFMNHSREGDQDIPGRSERRFTFLLK
jgi:hypothetical protein